MFLVDKYAPKKINDVYFNQDVLKRLKIMSKDESIPHIIIYGPEGCGKKTIIKLFLEMLYDEQVNKLVDSNYTVIGSGNSSTQVTVKQSNYHIVIEPNNNNFDRYLIQDVVKEYARRIPLNVFTTKKGFKTVLINNIDNMSYYAQTSLRRTLEKYSATCRFVMWSRSLSKVIDPLRSRCYCFKISAPSCKELLHMTMDVCYNESINIKISTIYDIFKRSDKNVKKILWLLELLKYGDDLETSYDQAINIIAGKLVKADLSSILCIRELLYRIMITNISGSHIIRSIVNVLLHVPNTSLSQKFNIVETAATYEHNLIRGRRDIIHLEAFVVNVMYIFSKHH